jgi:hypothetical protein
MNWCTHISAWPSLHSTSPHAPFTSSSHFTSLHFTSLHFTSLHFWIIFPTPSLRLIYHFPNPFPKITWFTDNNKIFTGWFSAQWFFMIFGTIYFSVPFISPWVIEKTLVHNVLLTLFTLVLSLIRNWYWCLRICFSYMILAYFQSQHPVDILELWNAENKLLANYNTILIFWVHQPMSLLVLTVFQHFTVMVITEACFAVIFWIVFVTHVRTCRTLAYYTTSLWITHLPGSKFNCRFYCFLRNCWTCIFSHM